MPAKAYSELVERPPVLLRENLPAPVLIALLEARLSRIEALADLFGDIPDDAAVPSLQFSGPVLPLVQEARQILGEIERRGHGAS